MKQKRIRTVSAFQKVISKYYTLIVREELYIYFICYTAIKLYGC